MTLIIGTAIAATLGCAPAPTLKGAPAAFTGKLSRAGRPVRDVMISFHPLDHGHLCSFPVKSDGTFQGELISGNYAYYVSPSPNPASAAAMQRIDVKYREPDLKRTIAVDAGQQLALALE
jgi:hypothetical protein